MRSLLLGVLPLIAGCTTVSLEIDRMPGTSFPDVGSSGLEGMFDSADVRLDVDEDEVDVPVGADAYLDESQVEALALGHRSLPIGPTMVLFNVHYHVYGLVLHHQYRYWDPTLSLWLHGGTLGIAYDETQRSGFAIFYREPEVQPPAYLLRTSAHEIGHTLNLNHTDAHTGLTLMTEHSSLSSSWSYKFSASSEDHLKHHDRSAVMPGMGPRHYSHTSH